jgi:pyruvate formate-lyase activating enzyme-like uncharacterized protein
VAAVWNGYKMQQKSINQQYGEPLMQIAKCVQRIQRAESVAKFKDEVAKKLHFEKYAKAKGSERLKMFHEAIAEGWVTA